MKKYLLIAVIILMYAFLSAVGDTIADPIIIDFPHTYVYSDSGSNVTYNNDYDVPGADGKDLVYFLSIPYNVSINISTEGSDYDTKLAIYNANIVPAPNNQLYYNDDFYGLQAAFRNLALSSANDYYIVLDASGPSEGNFHIQIDYMPLQGESYANPYNVIFDNNHQYFTNQSIQQFVDDYNFTGTDGKDVVYSFDLTGNYLFSAAINQVSFDVGYYLYDAAGMDNPDSTNFLIEGDQGVAIQNYPLTEGRYYLVVDSGVDNSGIFELQMQYVSYQGDEVMNPLSIAFIQDSVFTTNISIDNFNNIYDTPGLDSKDVVFVMSPTEQRNYNIIAASDNFHPHITIYDDNVTQFQSDNYLYHNNDFSTTSSGFRNLVLDPGTYYVVIDGENANGDFYLGIEKTHLVGDFAYNPIVVDFTPGTVWADSGSTSSMSNNYDLPGADYKDVVYSIFINAPTLIDISLDGSSFDTKLGIYSVDLPIDNVSYLVYNDDYFGLYSGIMNLQIDPGQYYIVVDGAVGEDGDYRIEINVDPYTTGYIQGYITSEETMLPLQDAVVSVGDITELTDSTGYYYIEDIPEGFIQVRAALDGYIAMSSDFMEVTGGDTTDVSLALSVFNGVPGVPEGLYYIDDFENIQLHWQPAGTLWSQIFNEGETEAHNAQDYVNGNTGYNSVAAADFVLQDSAHVESIKMLMSWGTIQYDQPISFLVKVYSDSAGMPDQQVISFTSAPASAVNNTYTVDFPINTYLGSGTYWVSYQAIVDWNATGAQAFAVVTPYLYNQTPGLWRNPGGQYALGTDWLALEPPLSTNAEKDFCFELIGSYETDVPPVVTRQNSLFEQRSSFTVFNPSITRYPIVHTIDNAQGLLTGRDLLTYNIYRDGSQINTEAVTLPRYFDQGLTTGAYNYYVVAVYEEGTSQPSDILPVTVNTDRIGTLQGYVTDADTGLPISNVTVTLNGSSAVTDTTGFYTLDASHGEYQLTAVVEDYFDYTHPELVQVVARTVQNFSFTMNMIPPAGIVSGYVYNSSSNNRIIGATVTIDGVQTVSGQNGLYSLSVPPGEHIVNCSKIGYDPFVSDTTITIADDQIINYIIPLSIHIPAGTLNGTVTDIQTTLPITGAEIAIGDSVVTTDSLGQYSVHIYTNHYQVTCSAENYYSDSRFVTIVDNAVTQANFMLAPVTDQIIPPVDLIANVQRYNNVFLSWSEPRDPVLSEYRHDDGEPNIWIWPGMASGNEYYAVKFANNISVDVRSAKIFARIRLNSQEQIMASVCPDDGSGNPDLLNPIFTDTIYANSNSYSGQWISAYPQDGVNTIVDEDFYVVVQWNTGNSFTVAKDTDQPANMSYSKVQDENWSVQTDGNFIMRAVVGMPDQPDVRITDRELQGYNIYRDSIQINQALVTDTYYLDSMLQNGIYEFFVTAVYDGGESPHSEIISSEIDFNGYYPPEYFTASNYSIFGADLTWLQPSFIPDGQVLSGYRIYMDSNTNMVGEINDPDSLQLIIDELPTGTHMFWLTAKYSNVTPEVESPAAGPIFICIRPRYFVPPAGLEYEILQSAVTLFWELPDFPDECSIEPFHSGYRIYKDNQSIGEVPLGVRVFNDLDPQLGTSQYYVTALYGIYESIGSDTVDVEIVGINDNEMLPKITEFSGNYPNPFNPETTLNYSVSKENDNSHVNITVYNLKGQRVVTLIDEAQQAGYHKVVWAGKDKRNKSVSSGIYFVVMKCGNYKKTSKMTLLK